MLHRYRIDYWKKCKFSEIMAHFEVMGEEAARANMQFLLLALSRATKSAQIILLLVFSIRSLKTL